MLFYPDQYFYKNAQQPRRGGWRRQPSRAEPEESVPANPWDFYYGRREPSAQPSVQQRSRNSWTSTSNPNEYMVLDEDELEALQAYRENRRRQREQSERREALLAYKKAEQERRLREAARQQAELRMRAEVEANAKAAARAYFRRKQAQQQALQQAQQQERERRQQYILEQLRNQFGLFTVPNGTYDESAPDAEQQPEQQQQQEQQPSEEAQAAQSQSEIPSEESAEAQQPSQERANAGNASNYDPIRTLIEALAPYPFVVLSESSDEEENGDAAQGEQEQYHDARQSSYLSDDKKGPRYYDEEEDGPTCETASEDSEPAFVEFLDPTARPPTFADSVELSPAEFEDEGAEEESKKDRSKERQASIPKDRRKKQKRDAKKKKPSVSSASAAPTTPSVTPSEVVGLLFALEEDLARLDDGYERISKLPPPQNLKEAVSRIEGIKIGYRRSEEIYNRMDNIRVGKDQRKMKHQITSDAVTLADKFDEILQDAIAKKEELSSAEKPDSPKHQVTLEEVQDESD